MKKLVYDLLLAKNRLNTHYIAEQYLENVSMRNIHNHSHYEILYICENERILIAEKKQYILNANSIALIPPYILHRTLGIGELSNRKYRKYMINFTKEFVEKISRDMDVDIFTAFQRDQILIQLDGEETEFVKNLMTKMIKYNNTGDLCDEQMFLMLLGSLLTFFAKKVLKRTNYKTTALIDGIINYMEKNFDREITLEFLAKQFFISKYEISRMFTKCVGISFVEYLTRIRIENSKKLLQDTSLSITRISEMTGFNSSSNFARVFRKTTGISPAQYRIGSKNDI